MSVKILKYEEHLLLLVTLTIFALFAPSRLAAEENPASIEEVVIIGITPTHSMGLPEEMIPYNVQSATAEDLERSQSLDITDHMKRNFGSVVINDAQNNPLQNDVQYRGFTASPLLGLPMGITVYQNAVRINEVLGDTVNWDLIPESAIANINLIGGTNPLYGLNTLGGAISITTKNGFTYTGHDLEVYGGSYNRVVTTAESGANNDTWGYYATVNYFEEDGWREASGSEALNIFTALSFRDEDKTSLDLNISYADTELIGNGPVPIELLAIDRDTIFTSPDITKNEMIFIDLMGEHWLDDDTTVSGNIFYRRNDVSSFNGDGSEFEGCNITDISDNQILIEGDADELLDNGLDCNTGFSEALLEMAGGAVIEDHHGNFILAENADGSERNAINNFSTREQKNYGGTLQGTFLQDLFEHKNQLIVGAAYSQGFAEFYSDLEIAGLYDDRSTRGSNLFVPDEGTFVDTQTRSWSLYLTDTFSVTDKLHVTLSARYNNTGVEISDKGGESGLTAPAPRLNGEHDYERINPAAGITYDFKPDVSGYAGYSESSRAPTPIELACADPDAPCNLPNSFLADPPLDQVVAKSFEGGFRGTLEGARFGDIKWHLGGFHTINTDDIIFISTGGVSANQGFFSNVGDTKRLGIEFDLDGTWKKLDWFFNYSYVEATFNTAFTAASPNHPLANDDGDIQVKSGDRIPGIPDHTFKVGGNYSFTPKLKIGADLVYNTGVYLRGDEANLLGTTDDYAVVNLLGHYEFNDNFSIFARVNNLFDTEYESFGLLGEANEIPGFENFTDNRFVGPGAPISVYAGVSVRF